MDGLLRSATVYRQGKLCKCDIAFYQGDIVDESFARSKGVPVVPVDSIGNCIVSPGFVDVHVHLREPGFSYKETIASGTRAAAHGGYTTVCAMRHPREGAPTVAAHFSPVPIINAGDGGHNHPTQTLADLLTIRREKGRLSGLTVGLCGDLQFGRTVHSLINAMSRYPDTRFVLISPEELRIPAYLRDNMVKAGVPFTEVRKLEDVMGTLDILYMVWINRRAIGLTALPE